MKKNRYRHPDKVRREKELENEWKEIEERQREPLFGKTKAISVRPVKVAKKIFEKPYVRRPSHDKDVRFITNAHVDVSTGGISIGEKEYSDEDGMLYREIKAQEEIAKKKKRIAPLYNKGAAQYFTEETDLTTLGKK